MTPLQERRRVYNSVNYQKNKETSRFKRLVARFEKDAVIKLLMTQLGDNYVPIDESVIHSMVRAMALEEERRNGRRTRNAESETRQDKTVNDYKFILVQETEAETFKFYQSQPHTSTKSTNFNHQQIVFTDAENIN